MNNRVKKTPLFDWHLARGAKMGNFGGYDMPLWYSSGPRDEHLSVLQNAGLFDTSHMAGISIKGDRAFDLLQRCFSKNLDACIGPKKLPLGDGRCVYGLFLNENGGVIDDTLVYRMKPGAYAAIVNAGMGGAISAHLEAHNQDLGAEVVDLTDQLGKIDLQGPAAAKIVNKIIQNPDLIFENMPYFSFKGDYQGDFGKSGECLLKDGTPVLLSRSGYTGEFGFELFVSAEQTRKLWEQLMDAGREFGMLSCGLAARDSLRAGAVLPLSHQDIGDWPFVNNPWPFALAYNDDLTEFTKDFIGAEALLKNEIREHTYPFVGYDPRKVVAAEDPRVIDQTGSEIGVVLTCATDMALARHQNTIYSVVSPDRPIDLKFKGLSCGFVKTGKALEYGAKVTLKTAKRSLKVEIRSDIRPNRTARRAMSQMR